MLRIKFSKVGKKKQPTFRLIVTERGRDPWGKVVENLGWRDPKSKQTVLKEDRIKYWLSQGAEPTDTVHNLFVDLKLIEGDKHRSITISKTRQAKIDAAKPKATEAEAQPAA